MKKFLISAFLLFSVCGAYAEQEENFTPYYKYRVWLKDKGGEAQVERQLKHPERYLSERSLQRRERQGFEIDITDVPVNPKYIKRIESVGLDVILRSKWNNTVVVQCEDTTLLQQVESMPFVKKVERVARYNKPVER